MRSVLVLLCLTAAFVFSYGCGPASTDGPTEPSGQEQETPETARVVCGKDGTRVLTPVVKARPDGVHLVIDNRLDAQVGYAFEHPEGGSGDSAPKGESEHVGAFPPGKIKVGCEKPPVDGIGIDYATLTVVRGDSGYESTELECKGNMAFGGGSQYAAGAGGKKGDPVEMVRRGLSNRLREGDTVELAGYPKNRDSRTVRVVRDGRVVATVVFFADSGGWLEDSTTSCAGF